VSNDFRHSFVSSEPPKFNSNKYNYLDGFSKIFLQAASHFSANLSSRKTNVAAGFHLFIILKSVAILAAPPANCFAQKTGFFHKLRIPQH
jgi:hypothetical protein